MNDETKKECPRCGESFVGDETVNGEICEDCLKKKTDYFCDNCGEPLFEGDEVSVKRDCIITLRGKIADTEPSDNRIDEMLCEKCK